MSVRDNGMRAITTERMVQAVRYDFEEDGLDLMGACRKRGWNYHCVYSRLVRNGYIVRHVLVRREVKA